MFSDGLTRQGIRYFANRSIDADLAILDTNARTTAVKEDVLAGYGRTGF